MPTDRDRFARVLDKRFKGVSYLIESDAADAAARLCEYILFREHEADPAIAAFFVDVDRVLTAPAMPLLRDESPDDERIRKRAAQTEPAIRLGYAYEDVRNGTHPDLATANAARCVCWVWGQIATVPYWAHLRERFPLLQADATHELSRMIKKKYLDTGDAPPPRVAKRSQIDIAADGIPVVSK